MPTKRKMECITDTSMDSSETSFPKKKKHRQKEDAGGTNGGKVGAEDENDGKQAGNVDKDRSGMNEKSGKSVSPYDSQTHEVSRWASLRLCQILRDAAIVLSSSSTTGFEWKKQQVDAMRLQGCGGVDIELPRELKEMIDRHANQSGEAHPSNCHLKSRTQARLPPTNGTNLDVEMSTERRSPKHKYFRTSMSEDCGMNLGLGLSSPEDHSYQLPAGMETQAKTITFQFSGSCSSRQSISPSRLDTPSTDVIRSDELPLPARTTEAREVIQGRDNARLNSTHSVRRNSSKVVCSSQPFDITKVTIPERRFGPGHRTPSVPSPGRLELPKTHVTYNFLNKEFQQTINKLYRDRETEKSKKDFVNLMIREMGTGRRDPDEMREFLVKEGKADRDVVKTIRQTVKLLFEVLDCDSPRVTMKEQYRSFVEKQSRGEVNQMLQHVCRAFSLAYTTLIPLPQDRERLSSAS
ncbi:hypothetical protein PM082_018326 [Marasmius tenuissimus]|nr:hypothetical protein PM082_018326 [Marasmius tenuissimus]